MTSTPGTSGGRRTRKKLATRRAIRRTALDLFTAHGFDAVTVEQITEAADVAPMTFYRHFGTKQALVMDIAFTDQIARTLDRALTPPGPGQPPDIDRALAYCQSLITRPADTTLVLVTDLEEGGNAQRMRQRMAELVASGVQFIVLLALNDDGAPFYDKSHAEYLASLGVPAFACTPDQFPNLMAAALNKQDLSLWVAENVKA